MYNVYKYIYIIIYIALENPWWGPNWRRCPARSTEHICCRSQGWENGKNKYRKNKDENENKSFIGNRKYGFLVDRMNTQNTN